MEKRSKTDVMLRCLLVSSCFLFLISAAAYASQNSRPISAFTSGDLFTFFNNSPTDTPPGIYISGPIYDETAAQSEHAAFTNQASGSFIIILMAKQSAFAASNRFGIYDIQDITKKIELFGGSASIGSQVLVSFYADGSVRVNFVNTGVHFNNFFGFYLEVYNSDGDPTTLDYTVYTEDILNNNGSAQALVYRGNGQTTIQAPSYFPNTFLTGDWIVSFEDDIGSSSDRDFSDFTFITGLLTPVPFVCGDGNLDPGEQCDDGNNIDGDDCSANCAIEASCGEGAIFYLDGDDDGYGLSSSTIQACSLPLGYAAVGGDCDDGDPAVNPGEAEVCNGIDDNCAAGIDEGVTTTFYLDGDSDNYGLDSSTTQACATPPGYADIGGDCDDGDPAVNPGAVEVCNGVDDNCIGGIDEDVTTIFYLDGDSDNYGLDASTTKACSQPAGYASVGGDCDDSDPEVNPGASEVCENGIDDNCSGTIDMGCTAPLPENSFGKQYEDLVPSDATVPEYDPDRFSVVTGLVEGRNGQPIEGVKATIHGLPEYGSANTDSQGRFSIPLDGGTTFTVVYEKDDFITSSRQVFVPWNDIAIAETIEMIGFDSQATLATLDGNPQTITTHKSTEITDAFGSRSTTIVIAGDNRAWVPDGNGGEVELSQITMRATEFDTPESMPSKLPPTSAYTYCAELSIDEAPNVRFDNPVVMYVDNFIGFNVGEIVPVGYYDRDQAMWIPYDNGIVVRLLDTDLDGVVDGLDSTGDSIPDDLDGDGSVTDETLGLENPTEYAPDSTFWRVEIDHFTPWDCNWPMGPPPAATSANPPAPPNVKQPASTGCASQPNPCNSVNSYADVLPQIFHEDIPIPGTEYTLHYSSGRTPGYKSVIEIPVSGSTVPTDLMEITVSMQLAGRSFKALLPALPDQSVEFVWDGRDHLGNPAVGTRKALVNIGFVYEPVYYSPGDFARAFGQAGSQPTTNLARTKAILWKRFKVPVTREGFSKIANGWALSSHNQLDPMDLSTLIMGNGTFNRNLVVGAYTITTVAGDEDADYWVSGDGGSATEAGMSSPEKIALDAKGNLYIADTGNSCIRKVDTNGIINTIAGTFCGREHGTCNGFSGDGGPATAAEFRTITDIALDSLGNLYIADSKNNRVRMVDSSGIITTVAGNGSLNNIEGQNGDDGPATEASVSPTSVAVDSLGNLFIGESPNENYRYYKNKIRKVDPNGIITTVISEYNSCCDFTVNSVETDNKGNIFYSLYAYGYNHIYKVDASGRKETIMEKSPWPSNLLTDNNGNIFISEPWKARIRKINSAGIISTVAGTGIWGNSGDGGPAILAELQPYGLAIDASGNIYVSSANSNNVRKLSVAASGRLDSSTNETLILDGSGLAYRFNEKHLHAATYEPATGTELLTFQYNENDQLHSVADRFTNQTTIQRDAEGVPISITSPDGLVTALTVDGSSHLKMVTFPDSSYYEFEYTSDGLMTGEYDPNGNYFIHWYDSVGRLTDIFDPEGGQWSYSQTMDEGGTVTSSVQTGELNVSTYGEYTDFTESYTQTSTTPFGAVSTFSRSSDGFSATTDTSCGMTVDQKYDMDPEFKFTFLKESTIQLPSGLTLTAATDRSYLDTNLDEIPDQIVKTVTVNGIPWTTANDTLNSVITATTPTGRTAATTYDPTTLLAQSMSTPELFSTSFGYDAKGRLETVSVGTRTTTMAYDANGNPDYVVTPDNQTIDYTFDVMGRLRDEIRPDGTTVSYDYDDNGNVTVLTNPKLIDHLFDYTANDQAKTYVTPLSGSYAYTYNKERNLKTITAPSGSVLTNNYANSLLTSTTTC